MKRLVLTLAAGALGTLMALPMAYAQSYQDMNRDAQTIDQEHAAIQHDKEEKREDMAQGRYGAASREKEEIQQHRAEMQDKKADLNNDIANHNYGDRHDDDDNR